MSEEKNRSLFPIASAIVLPILYVLSFGPGYASVMQNGGARPLWFWFYAPLIWLSERSTVVGELLGQYATWCHGVIYPILWK